jgi:hypothetical protein
MPGVHNTYDVAVKALISGGYMKNGDPYLDICARILLFLEDMPRFEAALTSVSAFIWSHYSGLGATTRNKFSRSLGSVAQQNKFQVSTRPATAPHPNLLMHEAAPMAEPMDIKLVGSYGDFYGLLRGKMFWKDSMDMEHGEYSHALQWLAIAFEFGARAADLYAKLPDYQSSSKKGSKAIPLWSYVADCFPDTKKAEAELTSNTYRSPQMITKHLLGTSVPIPGHFVSAYFNYVYRQRNLVSYDKTKVGTVKANYGQSSAHALDASRAKDWDKVVEQGKGSQPTVTRLDRKHDAPARDASKQVAIDVTFHDIPGKLWIKGDGETVVLN